MRPENLIVSPEVSERPPGDRIVVLSPHFDDDVIGCGGTLRKHVDAGNTVSIIYLTDGKMGDPSCPDKDLLSETRKDEARRATSILGIKKLFFLDEPETKLKSTAGLIRRLNQILIDLQPELIYIPSFLENHIDHFEANRILLVLARKLSPKMKLAAYEVWTPLTPNTIVDISPVIHWKEEALKQYTSQLRQVDYTATTLSLNRYRSALHLKGQGYAEAFLTATLKEYTALMIELKIHKRLFISRS